jgi:L-alanine-DL-glutamate epimerase-like enolase superfamily enzyme
MAHTHLMAALPRGHALELCMHQGPLQWAVLAQEPTIQGGWLLLPDRPGLGVALSEDLEARFPYIEGHYAVQVTR